MGIRSIDPAAEPRPDRVARIRRVILLYAAFAAAWILFSDFALSVLVDDAAALARFSVLKGWLFVAVSTLALLIALRARPRDARSTAEAVRAGTDHQLGTLVRPLAALAVVILAITAVAILFAYRQQRANEANQLEAVVDLRVAQIGNWLAERRAQAEFASTSALFADLYTRWHDKGDAESAGRLISRLIDFRTAGGAQSVLVLDERGEVVLGEAQAAPENAPELVAAAEAALATGQVQLTTDYGHAGIAPAPRIDLVAPLKRTGTPPRAALVLRIDPKVFLFPTLDTWPVPSDSARTFLVRRDGDHVRDLKSKFDAQPLETSGLLAARAIRGDAPFGRAIDGLDARGNAVLGVVRPVHGTDWFLVAKEDRAEIIAAMLPSALWILAIGLLALFAAAVGIYNLRQRQLLNLALTERAGQAEKLRALQMVEAITESSTDMIFAKDLAGRYLLFSRAACDAVGKARSEVVGRDDYALYPAREAEVLIANDKRVMQENRVLSFEEEITTRNGASCGLVTKGPLHDSQGNVIGLFGIARDITERRHAEATLRASEERLRLFVQYAPAAIAMFDTQMNYVAVSRRWLADYGLPASDLTGRSHYEVFPETPQSWKDAHQRVLAGAVERSDGDPFPRIDGRLDWVRWEMRPWRNENDAIGGALLFSEVITERMRMQAENERAAALVTATLESTDNGILVADESGRIVMWNRRLLDLVPDLSEEVLRTGDRAAILEHVVHMFADKSAVRATGRHIDRRPEYTDLSTVPLTDGRFMERFTQPMLTEGRVAGRVWSFRDVTARERAIADAETRSRELEEKVRKRTEDLELAIAERTASEQLARMIANNIPGRVAYWNSDMRCVFVNRIYCEFFGKAKEELIGRTIEEIFGETRYRAILPRVRGVLGGEPQRFEREERNAEGQLVTTLVHYIPDRQASGIRGFFVLASDVSDVRRSERHLHELNEELVRARDRADAANRAKSAFLANMSHEIRTPMNAIIGFTHLLQRDLRTPAQVERLAKVDEAAHHLLTIINDILDLSKIESGKLTLEDADFSLDALLSRTCALVADRARDKGLELVVDTGRVPDMLRGDPTRLSQALLNLLSNAVKFTDNGVILLRTDIVESDQDSVLVRFVVRDTGIGIAADKVAHLFEAFEQADVSTTRRFGGTGLGLAITRRIAQVMGGDAGVDSKVNVGSTFWFTARLGRGTPLPASITHSPLTGCRVLVADDVLATRNAIASMLATLGMRAEVVESGDEALARVQADDTTDPFDAVLVDADLPQMSGRQTAKKLSQLTLRKTPVCVLVVGCGQPDDPADVRERAGVLAKPVTSSSLHDCLLSALRFSADAPSPERVSSAAEDLLRTRYTGARVLLAEDNPINQEVALGLLQAVGLNVDLAVDGAKALAAAEAAAYDVILLDVQMPVMDGLEAARRIRALPAHKTTPILAMTANAFGEDRAACIAAGMNEHVTKPVDVQAMYAALLRWLPQDIPPQPSSPPRSAAPIVAPPAPAQVPAPAATVPLVDRLAGIPGFDADLGLRFCGNREESLLLVLQQFDALYGKCATTLVDEVAAGNRREAHRLAHSLNGASGVIGAERIQKLAAALEVALATRRNDAEVTSAAEQLQFALGALIQALRERVELVAAAPVLAKKPAPSPVSAALEASLDELEGLLGDADFGAGALYRQHADAIRRLLGSSTQTFEQHLRAYDYLHALDCLRAARARVMAA